jgi:hypothetical protein
MISLLDDLGVGADPLWESLLLGGWREFPDKTGQAESPRPDVALTEFFQRPIMIESLFCSMSRLFAACADENCGRLSGDAIHFRLQFGVSKQPHGCAGIFTGSTAFQLTDRRAHENVTTKQSHSGEYGTNLRSAFRNGFGLDLDETNMRCVREHGTSGTDTLQTGETVQAMGAVTIFPSQQACLSHCDR